MTDLVTAGVVDSASAAGAAGVKGSALRIGLSTTTLEPALTQGRLDGIGVYTQALLNRLPDAGCDVQGYAYPPLRGAGQYTPFTTGTALPHAFSTLVMRDLLLPDRVRLALPVALFHATDYRIVRMACPVVATLHDAITLKHPEWCNPRLRRLKNWVLRMAARRADHVIAHSAFAVTELVEYFGIDERHITVVPCGVAAAWRQPVAAAAVAGTLRQAGLEPGYFLFVGTLQPRKNVDRLLDAYLRLPAAVRRERQCVIVGRAGWRCAATIGRMRRAAAEGERIVWLGAVHGDTVLRHLYAGAGVFVFPSLHEGFGLPLAEAFAAGVPAVVSNTTSLPEVSQGAALESDPHSVDDIAAAMLALARDDALRRRCIAAGHARALHLTWEHTAQKTCAVYRRVLGIS